MDCGFSFGIGQGVRCLTHKEDWSDILFVVVSHGGFGVDPMATWYFFS